ncbi:hypothetical protein DFH06DRAFT_1486071 [Mycena polygramma]|nr:hypothetical protein DFH06DRAFT_1486071 [Mycena polygramma]
MEGLVLKLGRLDIVEGPSPAGVPLAAELWLEILSNLGIADLSTMRLAAREFGELVNPFLFNSCVLRIPKRKPSGLLPKIAFYTSPDIANAVRDCTVLGCAHNTPAIVAEICAAFPHFKNMRHLTIQYVRMSPTMIATIRHAALPKGDSLSLESLSLVSCITDFPMSSDPEEGTIPLKSFLIHNELHPTFPDDNRWLSLLNLDLLQRLDLAQPHMTHTFVEWLAQTPNVQLPMLGSLQLHLSGLDEVMGAFLSVLTPFSALRVLGVTAPAYDPGAYWGSHPQIAQNIGRIPDDKLPLLTSFCGPLTQSTAYCAGRTLVRHLKLYGSDLQQAADYTTLLATLQEIARAAPHLRCLELRIACSLEELTRVALAGSLPALRSLRVVDPSYSGSTIHELISTLKILLVPDALEVLFLLYRFTRRIPWPTSGAPVVSAIRRLARRIPTLRKICICCDMPNAQAGDDYTQYSRRSDSTMVWIWNSRASETVSEQTVVGAQCIDGPKINLGIRDKDFEKAENAQSNRPLAMDRSTPPDAATGSSATAESAHSNQPLAVDRSTPPDAADAVTGRSATPGTAQSPHRLLASSIRSPDDRNVFVFVTVKIDRGLCCRIKVPDAKSV